MKSKIHLMLYSVLLLFIGCGGIELFFIADIEYEITGNVPRADITYTNSKGITVKKYNVILPWSYIDSFEEGKKVSIEAEAISEHPSYLYIKIKKNGLLWEWYVSEDRYYHKVLVHGTVRL